MANPFDPPPGVTRPVQSAPPPPRRATKEDTPAPPTLPHYGPIHWLTLCVILALFGWLHVFLADRLIEQTNLDPTRSDQLHNMRLALETRELRHRSVEETGFSSALWGWFPHRTDGVVNPLWPWVASWFAPADMEPSRPGDVTEAHRLFFQLGKWINVAITGGFLIGFGLFVGRRFTLLGTINLVLLGGLGALLPRAVFFQPEPLYYIFFFLTWACCLALLKNNPLWLYAVLGLCAGIAYLAKTSITPLILVFLIASSYRFIAALFPRLLGLGGSERTRGSTWSCRNHFLGLVFFIFAYVMTIGPRLDYAQRTFGDMFHSYPKYWMWMDTFEDGFAFMNEYGTAEKLDSLTDETKPSAAKYFREHTAAEAWERLEGGVRETASRFFQPPRRVYKKGEDRPWKFVLNFRGAYLGWLALALGAAGVLYTRHRQKSIFASQRIQPAALPSILFVLGAFAAYTLAYGWYVPIGKGDRFMLSLYLPLAFSLVAGAESIIRRVRRRNELLWIVNSYAALQAALALALAWRIWELVRFPNFID